MDAAKPVNLNQSLFKITTGHGNQRRVCGSGFVFHVEQDPGLAKPNFALALTPFSVRVLSAERATFLYQEARFQDDFPIRLKYLADNPGENYLLAFLKLCKTSHISPAPLSFKLPEDGAQVTCEKPDGSFPTTYRTLKVASEPTQFLLGPMAPPEFIGSVVVHEGKIVGLACSLFYAPPNAAIIGIRGGVGLSNIFEYFLRGVQGSAIHPDGHKHDLPPEIAAVINRMAG